LRALLDGDIYAFRSASSSENEDVGIAIWRLEGMIDNTLAETKASEFSIFLSGDNNFRYDIYPEYKANMTQPKPRHLKALKEYLVTTYEALVSDGCEADDLLGIEQCKGGDTIICSIDKDLRMIPGKHYSFEISGKITRGPRAGKPWVRPMEMVTVSEADGLRKFYYQLLVGDRTDNVMGAAGVGPVTADRILASCGTERELFEAVSDHYGSEEELLMTGQCLWIFRKPNDRWEIPTFETSKREGQGPSAPAVGEGLDPEHMDGATGT
jgi:5'-3' exonuclease